MLNLIGTDEAGYGPNLGPLTIGATTWQLPKAINTSDLYTLLGETIVQKPREADTKHIALADSKILYNSGKGLRHLERGLFAALALVGRHPQSWRECFAALAPQVLEEFKRIPWYANYDEPLPIDITQEQLGRDIELLRKACETAKVKLTSVQALVVPPERFNYQVDAVGSKGVFLSQQTLELVANAVNQIQTGPIHILCDKHGGRNRYADLLGERFPKWLIEIYGETREISRYQFGPPERRIEIAFQMKAESTVPAALASMAAKYLREISMRAFNHFWCKKKPGLAPTAGYPQDARRFRKAITPLLETLAVDESMLWRRK